MIIYSDSLLSLAHEIFKKNPAILAFIRDRRYKISDTDISYRQLNSLDQAGLLDDSRKSEKQWRTFNTTDLLYLNLIKNLRGFDVRKDKIKYIQKMFYKSKINFKGVGGITDAEIAIVGLLLEVVPIGILVFSDGEAILTDSTDSGYLQGHLDIKKRSHLFIMLYETFKPEIAKFKAEKAFQDAVDWAKYQEKFMAFPLSRKDRNLLDFVKGKEYTKITIEKKQNGEILLKGEKITKAKGLSPEDIMSIIDTKAFGRVDFSKQDGKIAFIEETDYKKI